MSLDRPTLDPASAEWSPGWERHELDQLRRMATLTLAEKLEWLEEAHTIVIRLARAGETAAPSLWEATIR